MATRLQEMAVKISTLAAPDMRPRDLMKAVREAYPDASKKDVVRAAFYAVIATADEDAAKARRLQAMAIEERRGDIQESSAAPRKRSKRNKGEKAEKAERPESRAELQLPAVHGSSD